MANNQEANSRCRADRGVSCFPSWGFMFSHSGFHVFLRRVSCFPLLCDRSGVSCFPVTAGFMFSPHGFHVFLSQAGFMFSHAVLAAAWVSHRHATVHVPHGTHDWPGFTSVRMRRTSLQGHRRRPMHSLRCRPGACNCWAANLVSWDWIPMRTCPKPGLGIQQPC